MFVLGLMAGVAVGIVLVSLCVIAGGDEKNE
jgi:hypothetical protein